MLLSGAATRLAPCFVGLDKRYVTDVDLDGDDVDGRPGRRGASSGTRRRRRSELDAALERLRGEVELPIPAASAVKIGGERAYKLARRGVAVEMPLRRSLVYALDVIAYSDADSCGVRLDLHVSSGTYVRAIAQALGGHCTTLRRTAVGPFGVDEARRSECGRADPAVGSARAAAGGGDSIACRRSVRAGVLALEQPAGGEPHERRATPGRARARPRAVAIGTFDGVHLGHRAVIARRGRRRPTPTVVTFHPHPRTVLGNRVELLATLERRLELLAECGVEDVLVVEFTPEIAALAPAAFAERVPAAIGARGRRRRRRVSASGAQRAGDLELLRSLGLDAREVPLVDGVSSTPHPRSSRTRASSARPPGCSAGRSSSTASSSPATSAAARSASRPRTSGSSRDLLVPEFGIYAGAVGDRRAAISIGVNPHYGGTERRIEAYLLDWEGDLYGDRLVVELWQRLRDERAFASEADLIAQIAEDVEQTRAARRPG